MTQTRVGTVGMVQDLCEGKQIELLADQMWSLRDRSQSVRKDGVFMYLDGENCRRRRLAARAGSQDDGLGRAR